MKSTPPIATIPSRAAIQTATFVVWIEEVLGLSTLLKHSAEQHSAEQHSAE